MPMDFVKFALKYTIIAALQKRKARKAAIANPDVDTSIRRTASRHESLYSNRTSFLSRALNRTGLGKGQKVNMNQNELSRFGSIQAQQS
jgi:H+-transporting ATPase